jgi:hypothetical protein
MRNGRWFPEHKDVGEMRHRHLVTLGQYTRMTSRGALVELDTSTLGIGVAVSESISHRKMGRDILWLRVGI